MFIVHRATGEISPKEIPHLAAASIRNLTLPIRWNGVSAYASQDYPAGLLTWTVSPSGFDFILSQPMMTYVTWTGK